MSQLEPLLQFAKWLFSSVALVSMTGLPSVDNPQVRSFKSGVSVNAERHLPPFAALEDQRLFAELPDLESETPSSAKTTYQLVVNGETLEPGELYPEFQELPEEEAKEPNKPFRVVRLKGLTVSRSGALGPNGANEPEISAPQPQLAQAQTSDSSDAADPRFEKLRQAVNYRDIERHIAEATQKIGREDLAPLAKDPRVVDAVKDFMASSMDPLVEKVEKTVQSFGGAFPEGAPPQGRWVGPVYVAKGIEQPSAPTGAGNQPSVARRTKPKQDEAPSVPGSQGLSLEEMQVYGLTAESTSDGDRAPAPMGFAEAVPPEPQLHVVIRGPLELSEGLALGATERLEVFREVEGQVLERGHVDYRAAKFEIFVEDNTGYLVAQLLRSGGEVIGQARLSLRSLPKRASHEQHLDISSLKIKPFRDGAFGQVQDADSMANDIRPVKGAEVRLDGLSAKGLESDEKGQFHDPGLAAQSTYIVVAGHEDYWPTIDMGEVGQPSKVKLFRKKMIRALLDLVEDHYPGRSIEEMGIVWGQVFENGKPAKGAEVLLKGDFAAPPPVYFEYRIPRLVRKKTDATGLFAFVGVKAGTYMLQAVSGAKTSHVEVRPVAHGTITPVNLELSGTQQRSVYAFDALNTDKPLNVRLSEVGTAEWSETAKDGTGNLLVHDVQGRLFLDAEAVSPYGPTRISVSRRAADIFVPMVRYDWLDDLAQSANIRRDPGAGTLFGFLPNGQTRLALELDGDQDAANIVLFDKKGQPILDQQESESSEAMGFAVFNVPPGLQQVQFLEEENQWRTHVFLVDAGVVNTYLGGLQ